MVRSHENNLRQKLRQLAYIYIEKLSQLEQGGLTTKNSAVVYVDDGSKDTTWELIEKACAESKHFVGIKLSRNRGHQNALLAGLLYAQDKADAIVSIDADLQDDIDAIDKMVEKFHAGYEIVYGVRSERKKDSFFKLHSAQGFYKMMRTLGVDVVYNAADFRLMSKRAVEELAKYEEVNLFLRGIVPLLGLKWTTVNYKREKRFAGESKYPLKKMFGFAWDGVTSFSIKPLRLVLTFGVVVFLVSLVFLVYSFIQYLCGNTVTGWTFLACSIWIVGGLQMACIGLIGEYIGKIYAESKRRPRYTIERVAEH